VLLPIIINHGLLASIIAFFVLEIWDSPSNRNRLLKKTEILIRKEYQK